MDHLEGVVMTRTMTAVEAPVATEAVDATMTRIATLAMTIDILLALLVMDVATIMALGASTATLLGGTTVMVVGMITVAGTILHGIADVAMGTLLHATLMEVET